MSAFDSSSSENSSAHRPVDHPGRAARIGLAALQMLVVGLVLFVMLDGWHRDFRVPISFSGDAPEYLMQAKGTIENGWWWTHPRLSAPLAFSEVAYPSATNVDQALVWLVSVVTTNVGLCVNISWFLLVMASAVTAMAGFTRLGASTASAFAGGVLFALSPFALARNLDHLSLATFLVPIPCTVALLVATGRIADLRRRSVLALAAGCVLLAFNYTYYPFFACFLLLTASAMAAARDRRNQSWVAGLLFACVIAGSTAINLAPSLAAPDGQLVIPGKSASEADVYGLSLRELVRPVWDHTFPPFRWWDRVEDGANLPLDFETSSGRLGVVGVAGLVALLASLITGRTRRFDSYVWHGAAGLVVGAILLGTFGGFGSLFNLFVAADIRAYARIVPFIHFYTLLAVALLLDRARAASTGRGFAGSLVAAVLAIGVYDQSHALLSLNRLYGVNRAELDHLQAFADALERRLPQGAMVFQLPVSSFPVDEERVRMGRYDQVKPYLVSHSVHWSFPASNVALASWQRHVSALPMRDLAVAVRANGFAAVVIDRFGYEDDAQSLLKGIEAELPTATIASSDRYVAIDLSGFTSDMPAGRIPTLTTEVGAASRDLSPCGMPTLSAFDVIGSRRTPFGLLPIDLPLWGDLAITGWAVDATSHRPARDVDIVIGDRLFPTLYGTARDDVAAALKEPAYRESGFLARITRNQIPDRANLIALRVVSTDGSCFSVGRSFQISVR